MLEEGQFDGVEVGLARRMGNGGGWGEHTSPLSLTFSSSCAGLRIFDHLQSSF